MGLYVSTTGTSFNIIELGLLLPTPTVDYDISGQFDSLTISQATSLTTAIRAGTLVWKKTAGGAVQVPTDYDPEYYMVEVLATGSGALADRIARFQDLLAININFDNTLNGFVATKVQAAIEEAKSTAEGLAKLTIPLVANGTLGNNQWLTYNELLPNRRILFPYNLRLDAITWDNDTVNVSGDFQVYKNGILAGNLIKTLQFRSPNNGYGIINTGLGDIFAAGDWIRLRYLNQGTNMSDTAMVLWITRLP